MIDKYRVNAWSKRKEAIDAHLKTFQTPKKPVITVDALLFWLVVLMCVGLLAYLFGYSDGRADMESIRKAEPSSLQTKCTAYDIRDGQKYCLRWKRV